jgi:antirestriction protein ArdC
MSEKKRTAAPAAYQAVTDHVLALLEAGTVPWRQPWASVAPANVATGRPYRGLNRMILTLTGHEAPLFLTRRQAEELGGSVRHGATVWPAVAWIWPKQDEEQTEEAAAERRRQPTAILAPGRQHRRRRPTGRPCGQGGRAHRRGPLVPHT